MAEHPRFKAHAYVDYHGAVHNARLDGWALFGDIWVHGPNDAHFCIAEATDGEFVVWEFQAVMGAGYALKKDPPEPWARGSSLDGMVMKAVHDGR